MRKIFTLMTLGMLFSFVSLAQNTIVKGKVSSNGTTIAKATVSLLNAADSQLVKAAIANANGEYEIENVKAGNYLVQISNVGYKASYSKFFTITDGQTYTVENINLLVAPKVADAATVTGAKKKPMIEVKADKMIFNVENSINAIGTNAFELLRKSPGVVIDKDDNLMLKGKNGVRIFLDGKPTVFDGRDLAAYLKTINSADIEAIEIITNPSAKYEAEGNAGIINIKLKKSKKLGYNGSVNLGFAVGIHPKTNSSVGMNYRKNSWNVFGNYSNNFGKNQNSISLYRVQDFIYDGKSVMIDNTQSHNFKVGADYQADKTSTIGVTLTGNLSNGTNVTNSTTPIFDKLSNILNRTLTSSNTIDVTRNNYNANFNYRYADTNGIEVSVDLDKGWFDNDGLSFQPNEYRNVNDLLNPTFSIFRNYTPTRIDINSAKLDIAFPVKKGKLEVGGKYAKVITKNASDFYNVINGIDNLDLNLTNKFNYTENINALYANFNRPINQKLTVQAGLRMENTKSEGDLISANTQSDANVKREYTNLFPSAAISYNVNMKNALNLTYSRRIDRPGYQDLNPFEFRLDELTFQKGNAFLRPQYSNAFELTHTYKYMYNTTFSFTRTTDLQSQIVDSSGTSKSFITQRNFDQQDVMSVNFSAPIQI